MANTPETKLQIDEVMYTPQEVAGLTKFHITTVQRLFMDEPGVIRLGHGARGRKRQYFTLRIPASVVSRVLGRMTV